MKEVPEVRQMFKELRDMIPTLGCRHCQLVLSGMMFALGWVMEYPDYAKYVESVITEAELEKKSPHREDGQ